MTNVVPHECEVTVDLRVPNVEAQQKILDFFDALQPFDPDCRLEVEGGVDRPPYDKFDGIEQLFQHAKGIAAEIGFELQDLKTGGGSDGNFTGALGIPTLDGLGADGHGAHSYDEFITFSSLAERAKLMLGLLRTLK
jgi:glutamate carboxypeptidase